MTTQFAYLTPDQLKATVDTATVIACLQHRLNALQTSARTVLA